MSELLALVAGSNASPGWRGMLVASCTSAEPWQCEHEHGNHRDALDCAVAERIRRMSEAPEQPPMEVWLRTQDERRIACTLRRDPEMDRNRVTYWEAIPVEDVELGTYDVEVITPDGTRGLPPHTGFHVRVEKIGPGLDAIGKPADIPAGPVADGIDDFLDHPETGVTRERPQRHLDLEPGDLT